MKNSNPPLYLHPGLCYNNLIRRHKTVAIREDPMSNEVPGLDWSGERMLPAFQAPQHLDIYDLRGAASDVQLAVTTMAGIINRPQPRVYLITSDDDSSGSIIFQAQYHAVHRPQPAMAS